MDMHELYRYNLPEGVIAQWRARMGDQLLPLQERAVKRHNLFGNGNLLIQAPTSSGKTFIAELAAVHTAIAGKKVIYLVPLKALAEEKFRDFTDKYSEYGLKVIVSSRDRREFDRDFEEGRYEIAVVVYEKLAQLLVRRPERLEQVELVLADELELLSDPERGATAELLLTRVLQASCRLIGLSAVIGGAGELAGWMRADLVYHERRPVELRYGVLYEGVFRYRTYNALAEGTESFIDGGSGSNWETLTQNVQHLTEQGETCLIFVKSRRESRRGAQLLSGRVSLGTAARTIAALRALEPTRSRAALIESLACGVAFHNTDLSPTERHAIEEGFRCGEVRVMVSTSTLAVGLNLPARNVFIAPEKWRYDDRLGMPWKTPILHAEYENMGGRAGRYGAGHAFGRAVLVAATPFDRDTLWRRYIEGERERIEPRLAKDRLENHVLRLVASRTCRHADDLLAFLEQTLSGRWVWAQTLTIDEIAFRIRGAVHRCTDAGMLTIHPDDERLEATPLGHAVAAKGISLEAARELEHWIAASETRAWCMLDLLYAAASTSDARLLQVGLTAAEYDEADYPARLRRLTRDEELQADVPLNRLRNSTLQPFFEDVRAIKVALILHNWIGQIPVQEIEETHHTMAGQIVAAAEQISWIIDTTAALAEVCGAAEPFVNRLKDVAGQVAAGVHAEALPLVRAGAGLTRTQVSNLMAHGLHTPEGIMHAPAPALRTHVSAEAARRLHAWARAHSTQAPAATHAPAETPAVAAPPVLIIDDAQPGGIYLEGEHIGLQEKQYRLIRVLAQHAGECVPYDTIYPAVWGDAVVEQNQMHFQKANLLKRIAKVLPQHSKLITTIPRNGFMLHLQPDQVSLQLRAVSSAA